MKRAAAFAAALACFGAQPAGAGDVNRGRALFVEGCSACHGLNANGVHGAGPSLHGAGAAAADFYLSTGRMPLDAPGEEPAPSKRAYPRSDIDALVAYIGSLGGPPVPSIDPAQGSLSAGQRAFTDHCAGCHQVMGRGGVVTGGFSPDLEAASAKQIAEAVRVGPYLMPGFDRSQISDRELASIARYVLWTRHPTNRGGWGIFEIGPVPEGMITWLVAAVALLLFIRVLGERTE